MKIRIWPKVVIHIHNKPKKTATVYKAGPPVRQPMGRARAKMDELVPDGGGPVQQGEWLPMDGGGVYFEEHLTFDGSGNPLDEAAKEERSD